MSNLEALAIMLAAEVELTIASGIQVPTALVDALNRFKRVQVQDEDRIGADLEAMYKNAVKLFNKQNLN